MKWLLYDYTYSDIKWFINFVRKQGATDVKEYIKNRAEKLNISFIESLEDVIYSAIDWRLDIEIAKHNEEKQKMYSV